MAKGLSGYLIYVPFARVHAPGTAFTARRLPRRGCANGVMVKIIQPGVGVCSVKLLRLS